MGDIAQQRNRAWRHKQKFLFRGRDCRHNPLCWKPPKRWKYLCSQQDKLSRARQLRIDTLKFPKQNIDMMLILITGFFNPEYPVYLQSQSMA